ncbi:beta-N-acetylhexosaminidase [Latilactobacillus fuchuensis]|uniref:beta-N-acetylhexosaminidase n=1 Tax=Latilactobacillus fuchuensis TaxID=164393 RepID=UPI0020C7714D|nr:beta-N-acetylhexosaminidase [Latilactobacillus fuchuensis]MCP8857642.1 beta-N-acetylhexosaminidase [Latilactobacillus fuchuensis]
MIKLQGLTTEQRLAAEALISDNGDAQQLTVDCQQGAPGICLTRTGNTGTIIFGTQSDLMHAVALYSGLVKEEHDFEIKQATHFDSLIAMLDVARNGVPTVEMLKTYIRKIASMGYTELWLYLEDLFEVPEEPYFGQGRGRYSQADLHTVAVYGEQFGVTVVPAIQTLAHMHNALKWDAHHAVRDTNDTLLVDAPATKTFIQHLLQAATAPFLTNKIHIGMDEAYQLGRGGYLDQNGFTDQQTLILNQLKMVVEVTESLGLDPYMWSDLWFTFASPKHEMYDPDVHFSPEFKAQLPKVGQVYWDYYHEDQATYLDRFKQHFELSDNVVFAGGIWTWSELAPNQSKMLATVEAGLSAAKKANVRQVIVTMWFDDGAEVPISAAWYGLQAFAAYQYHDDVTQATIDQDFELIHNESPVFYKDLEQFDNFTGGINVDSDNVSKIVLYEDLLLQRYEFNLKSIDLVDQWQALAAKMGAAKLTAANQLNAQYYQILAQTLIAKTNALKAVTGLRTGGIQAGTMAIEQIKLFQQALRQLSKVSRQIWHQQRRGNGYEVIDLRLGAQMTRADTVIWRITEWQAGRDALLELQAPVLQMDKKSNGLVGHALYQEIVSAGDISF